MWHLQWLAFCWQIKCADVNKSLKCLTCIVQLNHMQVSNCAYIHLNNMCRCPTIKVPNYAYVQLNHMGTQFTAAEKPFSMILIEISQKLILPNMRAGIKRHMKIIRISSNAIVSVMGLWSNQCSFTGSLSTINSFRAFRFFTFW